MQIPCQHMPGWVAPLIFAGVFGSLLFLLFSAHFVVAVRDSGRGRKVVNLYALGSISTLTAAALAFYFIAPYMHFQGWGSDSMYCGF